MKISPKLISFVLPLCLQILTNTKTNTKTESTGTKSTRRTRKKTGKSPSTVIGEEKVDEAFVGKTPLNVQSYKNYSENK